MGKYVKLHDAYLSVAEALRHAGWENGAKVTIDWVDSEQITDQNAACILKDADGIILPGGFGGRGIDGMIASASLCAQKQRAVFWNLSWHADCRHRICTECCRLA